MTASRRCPEFHLGEKGEVKKIQEWGGEKTRRGEENAARPDTICIISSSPWQDCNKRSGWRKVTYKSNPIIHVAEGRQLLDGHEEPFLESLIF